MAQEETDEGAVVRALQTPMLEDVGLNDVASVGDAQCAGLRPALVQHPARLIEQRDARTVPGIVRQPVAGAAREIDDAPAGEPLDHTGQQRRFPAEHVRVGNRRRSRTLDVGFFVLRSALVVVAEHALAEIRVHPNIIAATAARERIRARIPAPAHDGRAGHVWTLAEGCRASRAAAGTRSGCLPSAPAYLRGPARPA